MQETEIIAIARSILGNQGVALSGMDGLGNVHAVGLGNGKHAVVKLIGPSEKEDADKVQARAVALADALDKELAGA